MAGWTDGCVEVWIVDPTQHDAGMDGLMHGWMNGCIDAHIEPGKPREPEKYCHLLRRDEHPVLAKASRAL